MKNNKRFKQIFDDLEALYKATFSDGLKIEPDSYGGFCLRNGSKRIKAGEIQSSVGLLVKIPPEKDFDLLWRVRSSLLVLHAGLTIPVDRIVIST